VPAPLQTMFVPQLVPADLLPPSTQVIAPVEQDVEPFLQTLGLVLQAAPPVQATHVPDPLQTRFVPQVVPAAVLPPSTQVIVPLEQDVVPTLQLDGLPVHDCPVAQATHRPVPLQTMLVPQETPGDLLPPSTQVIAPVEQEVEPFRQLFGLLVQAVPAVHETQLPEPLQTMLVPQPVPAAFALPLTQVDVPVVHAAPAVHDTQVPEPLQTMLVPQVAPAAVLPPSTQVIAPLEHEVVPVLQLVGLPVHD
jgi:hypothetical protein